MTIEQFVSEYHELKAATGNGPKPLTLVGILPFPKIKTREACPEIVQWNRDVYLRSAAKAKAQKRGETDRNTITVTKKAKAGQPPKTAATADEDSESHSHFYLENLDSTLINTASLRKLSSKLPRLGGRSQTLPGNTSTGVSSMNPDSNSYSIATTDFGNSESGPSNLTWAGPRTTESEGVNRARKMHQKALKEAKTMTPTGIGVMKVTKPPTTPTMKNDNGNNNTRDEDAGTSNGNSTPIPAPIPPASVVVNPFAPAPSTTATSSMTNALTASSPASTTPREATVAAQEATDATRASDTTTATPPALNDTLPSTSTLPRVTLKLPPWARPLATVAASLTPAEGNNSDTPPSSKRAQLGPNNEKKRKPDNKTPSALTKKQKTLAALAIPSDGNSIKATRDLTITAMSNSYTRHCTISVERRIRAAQRMQRAVNAMKRSMDSALV
ncbi:hypothetical protein EDB85DRAFT_1891387 [Lactarius pseudohatsudake]|nr:hypothetical protein EDB85DRAFT_1891387 [Lactarius pseudohatsudake]